MTNKEKNKKIVQQSASVKRYDRKTNVLKTELKEFSIQLSSDSIDLANLDHDAGHLNSLIK
jgi:hypothetical protein